MTKRSTCASLLVIALAFGVEAASPAASPASPPCAVPSFAPGVPLPLPVGSYGISIAGVGDVNGDGAPDVVLSNPSRGTLLVFRNDGRGTFPAVETLDVGAGSFVATVADIDADGRADIVAVREEPGGYPYDGRLVVWLSKGATYAPPRSTDGVLAFLARPLVGDVDEDGLPDLLLAAFVPDATGSIRFSWLPNLGAGLFGAPRPIPEVRNSSVPAMADFDGDGHLDLLDKGITIPSASLSILSGDGKGGFTRGPVVASSLDIYDALVDDLDRDGHVDLVLLNGWQFTGSANVLLADGAGGFHQTASLPVVTALAGVGDVDRDGIPDLVLSLPGTPTGLSVYLGDGHGGFPRSYVVDAVGGSFALADFDRDGATDILRISDSSGDPSAQLLRNDCAAGQASRTLIVPVVASLPGANGASYRTRLTLTNRSRANASVEVRFTPSAGEGGTGLVTVPGEGQTSFDVGALLGRLEIPLPDPARVFGTIRLTASSLTTSGDFAAQTWVSVTRPGESRPSSGVSFPAISETEAFDGAALLGGLREDGRDRTNLGLVHAGAPDDPDVVLRVTLYPGDPATESPVVLPDVRLGAGRVAQLDRVLRLAGLASPHAFARVERVAGTSRFYAFAVVNDEGTSDGSFLPAVSAGAGRGQGRLVVPSVVESGAYTTDLFVTNAASTEKELRLEWVASGIATPTDSVAFPVALPPASQLLLDDLAERLRASGLEGIPPRGANLAGAFFASVEGGDVEGLVIGSRVTMPAAGATGRYGVFLPAERVEGLASRPVFLPVSQTDCSSRANLALVNAGEEGSGTASFHVEVWDGTARTLLFEKSALVLPARGFLQLSPLVPPCASANGELVVKVTREVGSAPFLAYAVVNDGARPGEGTGDGAVIGMRFEPSP